MRRCLDWCHVGHWLDDTTSAIYQVLLANAAVDSKVTSDIEFIRCHMRYTWMSAVSLKWLQVAYSVHMRHVYLTSTHSPGIATIFNLRVHRCMCFTIQSICIFRPSVHPLSDTSSIHARPLLAFVLTRILFTTICGPIHPVQTPTESIWIESLRWKFDAGSGVRVRRAHIKRETVRIEIEIRRDGWECLNLVIIFHLFW